MRSFCLLVSVLCTFSCAAQFTGGSGSGYVSALMESDSIPYYGGEGSGFAFQHQISPTNIYSGDDSDGYGEVELLSGTNIYEGGEADGHSGLTLSHIHLWTGASDDNWSNASNWTSNVLPDTNARVGIPEVDTSGGFFYPLLSSGSFVIGNTSGTPAYVCKELRVFDGASISQDGGIEATNYGMAYIEGRYLLLDGIFVNKSPGKLTIREGGILDVRTQ